MNPEQFILMMNDLPDAVIDSANSPVVKQNHNIWYMIPAVAACFIVLISAAIYPILRVPKPDITADPVIVAEQPEQTTAPVSTAKTTVTVSAAQITVQTETATKTASRTTVSVTQTLAETAAPQDVIVPAQSDTTASVTQEQSAVSSEQQQTTVPAQTYNTASTSSGEPETQSEAATEAVDTGVTSLVSESVIVPDTPVTERQPQTFSIPLLHLKTGTEVSESATPPNSTEGRFYLILAAESVPDADREALAAFDFDSQDCLMYTLRTNCADAKVTDAEMQDTVLTVHVTCTDAAAWQEPRYLRFALGIPKSLGLMPYQCSAVYAHTTENFHNERPGTEESETETITLTIY